MLTAIEKEVIQAFRQNEADASYFGQNGRDSWLKFGIRFLLDAGHVLRPARFSPLNDSVEFKADGSPSLAMEREIEINLKQRLKRFAPEAEVVGEEGGGALKLDGVFVAIDPVDGTWSLLNRCETHTTSLAFFENGRLFLGMVLNPVTGELAYALEENPGRLIQLSLFGEHDNAVELPLSQPSSDKPLVNVHPGRMAGRLVGRMFDAWSRDEISMVKAPGGSPAWALLEAAKGVFTYVNTWPGKPADPFDLAAGISLVRGAGGEVLGLDGAPAGMLDHQGPFVAGVDQKNISAILSVLQKTGN
jgi:fructose-1,6-bisphosphatase/inositol monophosphatase family enzyme